MGKENDVDSYVYFDSQEPLILIQQSLPDDYTSGCGGPTYGWTSAYEIRIGDNLPARDLPPGVVQWKDMIYEVAERYDLPAHYIAGIMSLESGGKADAGSPAGAMGLMQLIKSTAVSMAGRSLTTEEIYDPATNLDLGAKLLRKDWDRYNADPIKVAFAYNAGSARCGSGCVRDYQDKANGMPCIQSCTANQFGLVGDCYGGNTLDYGGKVAAYANQALWTEFPVDRPTSTSEEKDSVWPKVVVGLGVAAVATMVGLRLRSGGHV